MKKLFLIPLMACMMCVSMVAQNVAKIGNTEYATINAAFEAAANGATIQMIADADFQQPIKLNVNENETHKAYTLDLNGKMLTFNPAGTKNDYTQRSSIILYGGALNIINSVPGVGGITNNTSGESSTNVVMVHGTCKKTCNPETEATISNLFTYLNVAEGVNFYTTGIGVTIDGLNPVKDAQGNIINKGTKMYWTKTGTTVDKSAAFGVRIDVRGAIDATKYCVKANGDLGYPDPDKYGYSFKNKTNVTMGSVNTGTKTLRQYFYGDEATDTIAATDIQYTPYIHIFPSAVLTAGNSKKNTAAYCSGYARWLIEGSCAAANGVYVKSGIVTLNNAIVESTWTEEATIGGTSGSGINGAGWAIVAESKNAYAGETQLTIQGDTKATTEAEGGAALKETVDAGSSSKIESITIDGGSFTADNAILISETTAATNEDFTVTVKGITLTGDVIVGDKTGDVAINSIISDEVHTTAIKNEDGSTTVVISEGEAPTEYADFDDAVAAAAADPTKNIKWTGIDTIEITEAMTLPELQMISGSKGKNGQKDTLQQLHVHAGAALHIKHLIMNDFARIIVEPGAKLIVVGEQGMNAPSSENIVLETSDEQPGYFMFHPNVTSNRHPQAKIKFSSRGYQKPRTSGDPEGGKYYWQRFGVPSWKSVPLSCMARTQPTQYQRIVNDNPSKYNMWEMLTSNDDLLVPFASYAMTTQYDKPGLKYTFTCEIPGNGDAELKLYEKYNYFSNSYTAPVDIKKLLQDFMTGAGNGGANVQATIYLNDPFTNRWDPINNGAYIIDFNNELPTTIEPMQAFVVIANSTAIDAKIDYASDVWAPMMGSGSGAPQRSNSVDLNTARIEIVAADGTQDNVSLLEGIEFSSAFDNSYDAAKFMQQEEKAYIYAEGNDDNMGILATDNLLGTTFGLTTKEQTSFTMNFTHVNGVDYAIRDMLTGTETQIVEGATYMFSVPANATVEGRFMIVASNKVPTAIENVEVENNDKGIYNMAGQYVGTNYHILPAGVYVVDGKKIVK